MVEYQFLKQFNVDRIRCQHLLQMRHPSIQTKRGYQKSHKSSDRKCVKLTSKVGVLPRPVGRHLGFETP